MDGRVDGWEGRWMEVCRKGVNGLLRIQEEVYFWKRLDVVLFLIHILCYYYVVVRNSRKNVWRRRCCPRCD